jgi:FAD-dependent urate hydroxylase
VVEARESESRVALRLRVANDDAERLLMVDHVVAGSGYVIDVERLDFLDRKLRCAIQQLERAPRLDAAFETSVSGLRFIGPASAMSFGPLFRFVVGAEYTARIVAAHLASQASSA